MLGDGRAIGIVGAGAVGTILAAHLAHGGWDVVLVENGPRQELLREHGVRVDGLRQLGGQARMVAGSIEELANSPVPIGTCLLCTKSWSLRSILPPLQSALHRDTTVVCCQNGIGPEEEVLRFFPHERVARAIINFAGSAALDSSSATMRWFNPPNYLGGVEGDIPKLGQLSDALTACGLCTELVSGHEIRRLEFYKSILNSALNALCAICGITMQQAMTCGHTRALVCQLVREGLSVATALGFSYGANAEQDCMTYLEKGGDHFPSTWYDLKYGCPTEIEFINGKIVKLARGREQTSVELNRLLTLIIITHEIQSGVRKANDIPEHLVCT